MNVFILPRSTEHKEMNETEALPSIMYSLGRETATCKEGEQWCDRRDKRGRGGGSSHQEPYAQLHVFSRLVVLLFFTEMCPKPNGSSRQSYAFIYHLFSTPVWETACHSLNEIRLFLGDPSPSLTILLPLIIEGSTCLRLQGVKMRGRVWKEED